ncbi:hypothetical protein [Legionella sp. W05-934-2]|uniref:hypothetical protein n=1 Tax=Legionella sp. W05-934-2 TaxID=1198649 RepID=UPI0034633423
MANDYDEFIVRQQQEYTQRVESTIGELSAYILGEEKHSRPFFRNFFNRYDPQISSQIKKLQDTQLTPNQKLAAVLLLYQSSKDHNESQLSQIIANALNTLDNGISADVTIPFQRAAIEEYQSQNATSLAKMH